MRRGREGEAMWIDRGGGRPRGKNEKQQAYLRKGSGRTKRGADRRAERKKYDQFFIHFILFIYYI
jgi:hypothetical protein